MTNTKSDTIITLSANPAGFHDEADELTADMFASAIPLQHSHDYFCDEDLGLYVGVWDTESMSEVPGPYGMEEFMVVLEGQAQIKNNKTGNVETVNAGEGFAIPKGYDCQWQQQGYLRKFYVIFDNDKLADNQDIDSVALFKANQVAPNQIQASFINDQNTFKAGNTNNSGSVEAITDYRFIHVLSGAIEITSSQGDKNTYTAKDSLFIRKGEQVACTISADYSAYFCNVSA